MNKIDFSDTDKISQLFQQAVNQAIEGHRQRGESIAVSDEKGKVRVIPANQIPAPRKIQSGHPDSSADNAEENLVEVQKEM
jgi:hypothetical protein